MRLFNIKNKYIYPCKGKEREEHHTYAVYRDKKFVHEMQNKKVWDVKTKTEVFVYKKDEYGNKLESFTDVGCKRRRWQSNENSQAKCLAFLMQTVLNYSRTSH